jgi:hypothetical protein
MKLYQKISQDLVNSLSLQYEPVGVNLYQDSDSLPTEIALTIGIMEQWNIGYIRVP